MLRIPPPHAASRALVAVLLTFSIVAPVAAEEEGLAALAQQFDASVRPFLESHCLSCHGNEEAEAKLNLAPFRDLAAVRADLGHWELVLTRIMSNEMPPEDSPQPSSESRQLVVRWIEELRHYEANLNAGDPGPVPPRRLSNAEYNYTIRDLTGVDIQPTREFPLDPTNVAGFPNSGESLALSPALFNKYLAAAEQVVDHLALLPDGFAFAPFPVKTYSDRDRFATRRIVGFYEAQNTDYAAYLAAAWMYKHRAALEPSVSTLEQAAKANGVSVKYLTLFWRLLQDEEDHAGPIAELRARWEALPAATGGCAAPLQEMEALRDWILTERSSRQFVFPSVMIPELNPTTQPGVLWKNRLISAHRRKGRITEEEQNDAELRAAIERFCDVIPDRFVLAERGRMNLPFEQQHKGRLLGAGFHLQVGYYRDDAPLYDLVLTKQQQKHIDALWRDLRFVTDVSVRQFQDYLYFERAEGRGIVTQSEFDSFKESDRSVTSPESMRRFAELYVAAVKRRGLETEAIEEIDRYFVDLSRQIQQTEAAFVEAEPNHLRSTLQFASQAWRRPLTADESRGLLKFYRELREEAGLTHEAAIRDLMTTILVSPHFCFRINEARPAGDRWRLTSFSLANRLSYFLWSSMPDEQLLSLARSDELQEPAVLRQQVRRMLKDERAEALAVEFAGHWLDFRHFEQHVGVDRTRFLEFTDQLRESMFQEPVRFLADWIRRDGSVEELLSARHTFVDANLADHYGIPFNEDPSENEWRRVDDARPFGRGGLLPMAVFLTKSSPGLRTSPVKRGYWVVKQLLGEAIPPPPADVPELPQDEADLGALTLREVLEQHRESESCNACHARFDFAGLVFEAYGPIGESRSHDFGGKPIDDSTLFPDGSHGRGIEDLLDYLLGSRLGQFQDTLCRKLLAYGLSRSLLISDEKTVEEMKQALADSDGHLSSMVEVIVTSPQFRYQQRPEL